MSTDNHFGWISGTVSLESSLLVGVDCTFFNSLEASFTLVFV